MLFMALPLQSGQLCGGLPSGDMPIKTRLRSWEGCSVFYFFVPYNFHSIFLNSGQQKFHREVSATRFDSRLGLDSLCRYIYVAEEGSGSKDRVGLTAEIPQQADLEREGPGQVQVWGTGEAAVRIRPAAAPSVAAGTPSCAGAWPPHWQPAAAWLAIEDAQTP